MAFNPVQFMRWQWEPTPPGAIGLNSSNVGYYPADGLIPPPGHLEPGRFSFTPYGADALRQQVGDLYGVPMDEVLLTVGTSMANLLAIIALAAEGEVVAVERPTYEPLTRCVEAAGAIPLFFDRPLERAFRPDLDAVEACLKAGARLVVLSDLHNPSGAHLGEDDAEALAALAEAYGARILIDEVYKDFTCLDAPRSRRADGDPFVCTGSLTKVYGLSYLRVGWILGPREVLARAVDVASVVAPELAAPSQVMAMSALQQREEIVAWSRGIVEPALAMVQRFAEVEPRLGGILPRYGTLYFPVLPEGVDGDAFADRLLREHKVRVSPGRFFGYPRGMRLGLGASLDDLRAGLAKIIRLLEAGG